MPNWCNAYVVISGKKKELRKFCKYFLYDSDNDGGKKETLMKKFFARSFMWDRWDSFCGEHFKQKDKANDVIEISFSVDFAWSCWSCIFEGYPNKKDCVTLDSVLKKLDIETLEITTEEGGCGFEETIDYNKDSGVMYDSNNMPTYKCECGNEQMIASDYPVDETTCYECGKDGRFVKK